MQEFLGWVERGGMKLPPDQVYTDLSNHPEQVTEYGGEFFIRWNGYAARDRFGIIPGDCPPGTWTEGGIIRGRVCPDAPDLDLETSVLEAVRLRCDEGITALSGGVDSALIASLARRPCVVVGIEGCHDLARAGIAARSIGLHCERVTITKRDVEEGLSAAVPVIPVKDPLNASIAVTMFCITRWAGEHGYHRVLAGQGADELFGGYSRYLRSGNLEAELSKDFTGLARQAERDQAVAALHGTYISMPYLDARVVRAAHRIPAREKVVAELRKMPLRCVAERYIDPEIAWYDKKAMQYGSGVWRMIRELARHNGYKKDVQGYIDQFGVHDHGI